MSDLGTRKLAILTTFSISFWGGSAVVQLSQSLKLIYLSKRQILDKGDLSMKIKLKELPVTIVVFENHTSMPSIHFQD